MLGAGLPLPPSALHAEQALLSALMHETLPTDTVLHDYHFADPIHGELFAMILCMRCMVGRAAEDRAIALRKRVHAEGLFADVGGAGYVDTLWMIKPSDMQAALALVSVRECWALRNLIDLGEEVIKAGNIALSTAFQKDGWRASARAQANILAAQLRGLLEQAEAVQQGLPE